MATSVQRSGGSRTARYRQRQAGRGEKRVEVMVPTADVALIRHLATQLRMGGARAAGQALFSIAMIDYRDNDLGDYNEVSLAFFVRRKGESPALGVPFLGSVVDFFRNAPLVGHNLTFERDRSPGRDIDL